MDLAHLQERRTQLVTARENTSQSWHVLSGHLAEVDYQIGLLSKPLECELVESPVPANETEVE